MPAARRRNALRSETVYPDISITSKYLIPRMKGAVKLTPAIKQDLGAAAVLDLQVESEPLQRGLHEVADRVLAGAGHRHEGVARARHPPRVHAHLAASALWLPGDNGNSLEKIYF